jgi:transglutaminase-like putative cysteine protease
MIEAVRALGLAARFVSGYLHIPTEVTDGLQGGGNTHAWCQVYLPGAGWVEFDPTNGIVGSRNLIRVAVARDPRQALPLWGTFEGAATDALGMTVSVETREIKAGNENLASAGPPWRPLEQLVIPGLLTAARPALPRG